MREIKFRVWNNSERQMNIDERITNALIGNHYITNANKTLEDQAQAVKQLIRDVLAEVKPKQDGLSPGGQHYLNGFNYALDVMEAKTKELGL